MQDKILIEGHRPKSALEDEETLVIPPGESFDSVSSAVKKAREYLKEKKDLGLVVVYREQPDGFKEGLKIVFRNDEGKIDETRLID